MTPSWGVEKRKPHMPYWEQGFGPAPFFSGDRKAAPTVYQGGGGTERVRSPQRGAGAEVPQTAPVIAPAAREPGRIRRPKRQTTQHWEA